MIKFIYTIFFLLFISIIGSYIYIHNSLNKISNTSFNISNHKITISDIQTNCHIIKIQYLKIENNDTDECIHINNLNTKMNLLNIFTGDTIINSIHIDMMNLEKLQISAANDDILNNRIIKYIAPKKLHIQTLKLPKNLYLPFNTIDINSDIKFIHTSAKNINFSMSSDIKIKDYFLNRINLSYQVNSSVLNKKTQIKNIKLRTDFFNIMGNSTIDHITQDMKSNFNYTIHPLDTTQPNNIVTLDKMIGKAQFTKQNNQYLFNTEGQLHYKSKDHQLSLNYKSDAEIENNILYGNLNIFKDNQTLLAKTDFAYKNKNFILNNISCTIDNNIISGNLIIDENFLVTGIVNTKLGNLENIMHIIPHNSLSGSLNSTLIFSKTQNNQTFKIKGQAKNISYNNHFQVKNGSFDITMHNLSNINFEHIAIKLQNIDIYNMKFSNFNIKGNNNNLSNYVAFSDAKKFNCNSKIKIHSLNKDALKFTVQNMQGTINKHNFFSKKKSKFTINKIKDFIKTNAELIIDKGIVSINYKKKQKNTSISSKIYNLPIHLFEYQKLPFALTSGSMNGDINISYKDDYQDLSMNSELNIDTLEINESQFENNLYVKINNLNDNLNITTQLRNDQGEPSIKGFLTIPFNNKIFKENFNMNQLDYFGEFVFNKSSELIQLLNSDVHQKFSGVLDGNIKFSSQNNIHDIKTNIILENGSYENLYSNTKVNNISTRISTKNNTNIQFHDIMIADNHNKKKILGSGYIKPFNNMQFLLQFNTKNFPIVDNNYLSGNISGNIDVSGNQNSALISGKIELGSAQINIPSTQKQKIPSLNIKNIYDQNKKDKESRNKKYKIFSNISLSLKEKVFFIANGINAKLEGSLKIQKNITNPNFLGNLTIASGKYSNLGKVFKITEGNLIFDGTLPPSPFVDIKATSETPHVELQFHLSHSIFEPKITIQSIPKMSEEEALSLFLFGKDTKNISAMQMIKIAQSLSSLYNETNILSNNLLDKIPLDEFDINENKDGNTESITIGKYLFDNLYLQRDQNINNKSSKNKIQWKINPKLSIEATNSDDDENSLGVYWNIRY